MTPKLTGLSSLPLTALCHCRDPATEGGGCSEEEEAGKPWLPLWARVTGEWEDQWQEPCSQKGARSPQQPGACQDRGACGGAF